MPHRYWPLFDLRLASPELTLRPMTEADLTGEADRVRRSAGSARSTLRATTRSAGAAEPDLARCHGVDDFGDPVAGQHWVEAAVSLRDGRGAVRGIDAGSLCSAASGR